MSFAHRDRLRPIDVSPLAVRWLRHLFPLVTVGLAVHLLLPQIASLERAWQTMRQMPWWLVGLALLSQAASYAGSGYLLVVLVAALGERLAIVRAIIITLASNSIGLDAGGVVGNSAATFRWTRASGVSPTAAGLCGALPSLFSNIIMALVAIAGLLHLLIIHELGALQAVGFGLILLVLVALVGVAAWGGTHPSWLLRTAQQVARAWARFRRRSVDPGAVENRVNQLINTWTMLRAGGWRGPALGATLNIAFDMLTLYLLFAAAHHSVSPGVLLTGYGLPLLLGKVGFLPGGVGIVEATMTALYAGLGVPNEVTVVVILGYRLISFWLPSLLGFLLAVYLQRLGRSSHGHRDEGSGLTAAS